MSMIKRFRSIMAANFYAMLEKAEDPEKMLAQYLRDLRSDLGNVKAETASVMAEEQRTKRALDENSAEINKLQRYAERALELGNETDARALLERKAAVALREEGLKDAYEVVCENAKKMRDMHDKLNSDIKELEARSHEIKRKLTAAKTQEKINRMTGGSTRMADLDRLEEKADRALYTANAMAELNAPKDDIDDLMAKYTDTDNAKPSIDDELEALKNNLKKK
ncbi:PspA/IM30 family protein [Anaerobacillus sp. CMMVII]|uniref:PspA/IM30 family protein n=1 Tax=Anaerobacillus sp. CMMVII TaxID=2755588 RepID=UPI0021B84383|nr:PspA/IM30 family protein [Anaerobacillus sp. CMMVII]MCT8137643.1 PspA/IM30 family protein [Anaerobacillus sp. CMMVII]